jgi:hypothetical protein
VSAAARVAGTAYLLSIAGIVAAQYGIYARLEVPGDAAATFRNLVAHPTLLRVHAVSALLHGAGLVVLLTALYAVLAPVHRGLAQAAAVLRLVSALTWVGIGVVLLQLLRIEESLARPVLSAATNLYYAGMPFYATGAAVCFWLWLRSGLLPRGLALAGVLTSAWCALSGLAYLVFPPFGLAVNLYTLDSPMALVEIATSVRLVVRGIPR